MNTKEEETLMRLMEEVSTDELESLESEPYTSDDDIREPTYQGSSSEESSIDENKSLLQNQDRDMNHRDI